MHWDITVKLSYVGVSAESARESAPVQCVTLSHTVRSNPANLMLTVSPSNCAASGICLKKSLSCALLGANVTHDICHARLELNRGSVRHAMVPRKVVGTRQPTIAENCRPACEPRVYLSAMNRLYSSSHTVWTSSYPGVMPRHRMLSRDAMSHTLHCRATAAADHT